MTVVSSRSRTGLRPRSSSRASNRTGRPTPRRPRLSRQEGRSPTGERPFLFLGSAPASAPGIPEVWLYLSRDGYAGSLRGRPVVSVPSDRRRFATPGFSLVGGRTRRVGRTKTSSGISRPTLSSTSFESESPRPSGHEDWAARGVELRSGLCFTKQCAYAGGAECALPRRILKMGRVGYTPPRIRIVSSCCAAGRSPILCWRGSWRPLE